MLFLFSTVDYQGSGSLSYPNLSGRTALNYWSDILLDFAAVDLTIPFERYMIAARINPNIKITSSLESFPFFGTPEPRYKLGTYQYITGFERIILEDSVILNEITEAGEYIIYPYQSCPVRWCAISNQADDETPYVITFAPDTQPLNTNIDLFTPPDIFQATSEGTGTCGLILNLPQDVTADVEITYWADIAFMANSDPNEFFVYTA